MPEAYQAEKLDTQLENATFNFLQDRNANYRKGKTLYLSKIFDWYEEDFGENVSDFVAPYMGYPPGDLKIQYTDYDWNLNLVNPGVGAWIFYIQRRVDHLARARWSVRFASHQN